jgi:hypothetical protein
MSDPAIWFKDDRGERRKDFDVGETVFVTGHGLEPATVHEFTVTREGAERDHAASFMTDRHGALPPTVLIPYLGLIVANEREAHFRSHDEAQKELGRQRIEVSTLDDRVRARFAVSPRGARPQVFPSDKAGAVRTAVEHGKDELFVTARGMPTGCLRVYLVPTQRRWSEGDRIEPARDSRGTPVVATVQVRDGAPVVVPLGPAGRVDPGSYQLIARPYRPGWYSADDMVLQAGDVVSSRRITSIVIRRAWDALGLNDDSDPLTPDIAGKPLPLRPYFHFLDNFPRGTDVYAAIDPAGLPPGLVSTKAAIYVIDHKEPGDWAASASLADVSGPGGTPAVEIVPIVPGCINFNETLVWPNPQTTGKFDIVVDFGNNVADPALFATDATLDPPIDMIDGYYRVGFHVTEDPSLPGPSAGAIGQHDYLLSSVQVPSSPSGPTPTVTLTRKATIRYPATAGGVDTPVAPGAHPLVVLCHGNSGMPTSYLGYNYLLDHLAGHGFIAMSIHVEPGWMIEARARAIIEHLNVMLGLNLNPGLFNGHIDFANVGIGGHSRGAEAVVRAARINTAEALGWNIKAGVSIAPTDFHHFGDPGIPLMVIYGSLDGDVAGFWGSPPGASFTVFDIYDEAAGSPRSFVFAYGADHDRFNTEWASIEASTELSWGHITASDLPNLISLTAHEDVARAYHAAFFQTHLQGRSEQKSFFNCELRPSAVSGLQIYNSHQETGGRVVDNFEQLPHDPAANTIGGSVTQSGLVSPPIEDLLHTIDSHSPHQTAGLAVAWASSTPLYTSQVPLAQKDVSSFGVISFRVTQKYGSAQNPANQPQDLFVRLTDHGGNSRRIRASQFAPIPYPFERGETTLTKSAMSTVRIPLRSYTVENAGAQIVNMHDIDTVTFELAAKPTGEIEIDEIEFSS